MLLKLEISRDQKFEGRRFVQIEQRRSVLLKLEEIRKSKQAGLFRLNKGDQCY